MYGAILGDIIGSRFEFDRGEKTKDFELFALEDRYTDDTVMTIAIGDALLQAGKDAGEEEIRQAVIAAMQDWGHRYPNAGYGYLFYRWLFQSKNPKPYNSYGNGAAMRVSAAGWLYDSLERTCQAAALTAGVTHDHPEGIKGAACTAGVIYLSRTGHSKEEIRDYVIREYGYDLSRSLDQLRLFHKHEETCQDSLPKALTSFLEGESYEDTVRNAISLGGDTDTIGAIAGSMAEAFYGIPEDYLRAGMDYLPADMLALLQKFDRQLGRKERIKTPRENAYRHNTCIWVETDNFLKTRSEESMTRLYNNLILRMYEKGGAPAELRDVTDQIRSVGAASVSYGTTLVEDHQRCLAFQIHQDYAGRKWIGLFTDEKELRKGENQEEVISLPCYIRFILESACNNPKLAGVIINPYSQGLPLPRRVLRYLLEYVEEMAGFDGEDWNPEKDEVREKESLPEEEASPETHIPA